MRNWNFWIFSLLLLLSCKKKEEAGCFTTRGADAKETRLLAPFNQIELHDKILVQYTQDSSLPQQITVYAGENLIKGISTQVSNQKLIIRNNNRCNWIRNINERITLKLNLHNIHLLQIEEDAETECLEKLHLDSLQIIHKGGGKVAMSINVYGFLITAQYGAGELYLDGLAHIQVSALHDVSPLHSENLEGHYCFIYNYGTNDAFVKPWKKFIPYIYFRGDIYYNQTPLEMEVNNYGGTGKVIKQ